MRQGYFFLLLVAALFVTGCGSPCGTVCERWSECVGGPLGGVDNCADACSAKADSDPVYDGHVQKCLSCSESLVCSEAVAQCGIDCTISVIH
jgi:hypothetical protein